ncbi:MAG: tandem-95 repeat protein, partial [Gemmatimonadetes bacterium]
FSTAPGPLSGNYTVGNGGDFSTMSAAVAALNDRGVSGAVTMELTDNSYPSDTSPMMIGVVNGTSALNTVTIRAATNINPTFNITGDYGFQLNGSDYVTLDGLTIAVTGQHAVHILGSASNAATYNAVKNCTLSTGAASNSRGVYLEGDSSNPNMSNTVEGNTIENFGAAGIRAAYEQSLVLRGNTIRNASNGNFTTSGIRFTAGVQNAEVSANRIYTLSATTNSNVYGLWLANSQNNSYVNNMISDLNVTGTGNVRGIFLENNGTNSSFYFNSVYLTGTQSNSQSTTAFFTSSANGTPSLIVKNNIFVNMRESDAGGSHYAIQVANGGTMTQFADINYNDLYVSNNNGMGHVGYGKPSGQPEQNLTLLSDWQAALASRGITGADANSISGDPGFTSTTNLKLTSVSSPAVSAGVAISGITTDQEGTERPDPPSIGADDFRNDPPVWTPVPDQTFSEDGSPTPAPTINLATYASDPNSSEGDAIVSWDAEVVGGGTDLTVSVDGTGMASFSVASNWFGTKQVIFTATDTRHSSASDQIQVTVESVNDIPVFDTPVPDQSFDEDTTPAAIDLRQYVSDVETADDQLTWQVSSNMTELVPSVSATGSLTFTTEQDWYGTATVTVTVTDADNGSENDAFTVTVNPVNDAPVALDSYVLIVPYQGFADVTLADLAEDVDNTDAELSWTVLVPNDSINVTDNGTTFRFSHIGVSYGTYPVTLQVEDPEPLTDDLTITVIIPDPSNNPPQWSATFTAVNFNEDETPAPTVDLTQQVTDDLTPANQLIYLSEVIGGGTDLTVSIASGVATFNAAANWYGNKQVKFIAIDQLGGADTTTVTVTVNPVNDQPVFDTALPDVTFSEDGSPTPSPVIDLKSYVSDIETADANLTWSSSYTVVTLREDGSRSVSSVTKALTDVKAQQTLRVGELTVNITTDGVLSFTPAADWNGVANVTITATDEGGLSVSDDMQVTVENVNDAPVLGALDAQLTLTLSTPYDIALTSTDADNDTPTYTVDDITGFGSGFATIVGGNTLHFDPTTLGSGQVTVSVSDGNGGSDSHTFDVTVNYADPQIETRYETTNQNDDATASYTFQICTASGGDLVGFAAADAIVDVSYYATPNDQQILTDFASVSINMASSSCAEVTVSYDLSDSRLPDAGGITLSTTLQFVGSNIGQPLSTSLRINVLPTLSPQILALLGNLSGLTLNDIWPIADFNGDTCVEAFDLLVLLYAYGSANGDVHWNPAVDVALDGIFDQIGHDDAVNFADLARFAVYYGQGQCASARIASELDQLEGLFVSARDQKAASQTITSGVTAFTPVVGAETVHVGETFDVALTAQNVVDLFAGSITVGYTADVLELKSVAAGDLFAANGINAIFPDAMMQHTSGQVVVDVASLDGTGVMGSGTLATLTFEVKAAGEWNIQVDNVIALDTNLNAFENIQIFESKGSAKAQIAVPANYELYANYPNPFNPKTTIRFDIPATANVELRIYDVSGRLVNALVSETLEAGTYSVEWDGTNAKGEAVSSGVYFYQLHSEDFSATQSMILLK